MAGESSVNMLRTFSRTNLSLSEFVWQVSNSLFENLARA